MSTKNALERARAVVEKADLSLVDAAMAGQRALKALTEGEQQETALQLAIMVALCNRATAKAERPDA